MPIVTNAADFKSILAAAARNGGGRVVATAPTPAQLQGRKASKCGNRLEAHVLQCMSDRAGPVCYLFRLGNQAKWLPRKGGQQGAELTQQKGPFDFCGGFYGGPGLFFDAKNAEPDSGRNGLEVHKPSILKPHQIVALEQMYRAGQVAGVLVRAGPVGRFMWLPANRLRDTRAIGWDDPRWVRLGACGLAGNYNIPFRALLNWWYSEPGQDADRRRRFA